MSTNLTSSLLCVLVLGGVSSSGCDDESEQTVHHDPSQTWQQDVDPRRPKMLSAAQSWREKQKMMSFLDAIQQIQEGLVQHDWAQIDRATAVLAHAPQDRHLCTDTPAPDKAIKLMARHFRCRADGIQDAAQARDRDAVIRATSLTLQTCNGCHQAFRYEVVTDVY